MMYPDRGARFAILYNEICSSMKSHPSKSSVPIPFTLVNSLYLSIERVATVDR